MERHDLDLTSLIAGLLFIGLGTVFLTDLTGAIDLSVRWVWPALLMGLGIALLASGPSRRNGGAVPTDGAAATDPSGLDDMTTATNEPSSDAPGE